MKKFISKARKSLLRKYINTRPLPEFENSDVIRVKALFFGKVQGVGYRIEVSSMAKRLDLVGFVENLQDGSVLAEIEGQQDKIDHLMQYLSNIKRAPLTNLEISKLKVLNEDVDFIIKY